MFGCLVFVVNRSPVASQTPFSNLSTIHSRVIVTSPLVGILPEATLDGVPKHLLFAWPNRVVANLFIVLFSPERSVKLCFLNNSGLSQYSTKYGEFQGSIIFLYW